MIRTLFLFVCLLRVMPCISQSVVINEISQGATGSKEYVELLIVGSPSCNPATQCIDLRNWYLDDNNGDFAAGSGTGIAAGCIRLSNDTLWSCVPVGTMITIYNDADLNPSVPADDLNHFDGDCELVIPISNCNLFTANTATPNTSISAFPTSGFSSCGIWGPISMANGGDSFQVLDASGNLVHSVSWGNNTSNTQVYLGSGSMSAGNAYMANTLDNNSADAANWILGTSPTNDSPGFGNDALNAAWVAAMNQNCAIHGPLLVAKASNNAGCACDGDATVTPSGAQSPYTYQWTGGSTNASASQLCAGNYTVTVSAANGCSATASFVISGIGTFSLNATLTDPSCHNTSDGTIQIATVGGNSPFTYAWSNSATTAALTGLSAGSYSLTVTDAGGCSSITTQTITAPTSISLLISEQEIKCFGQQNGSISVTPVGGQSPYNFSWSNGETTSTITGLSAGSHLVTVTDQAGCEVDTLVTLSEPSELTAVLSVLQPSCGGTGTITASVAGGVVPYVYLWSQGGTDHTVGGLASGTYTLTVTDANGCSDSFSAALVSTSNVSVTVIASAGSCDGLTGSAAAAVSGGSSPYTYLWAPGGETTANISNVPAGVYSVTISDANGCAASGSAQVPAGGPIQSTIITNAIPCEGVCTGTAMTNTSGGTVPYIYKWNTGATTDSISGLCEGSVSVTVTDANSCTAVAMGTLTAQSGVIVNHTIVPPTCVTAGSISLVTSGGQAPYNYNWDVTPTQTDNHVTGLTQGVYHVTVSDANGCTAIKELELEQQGAVIAGFTADPAETTPINPDIELTDLSQNSDFWSWYLNDSLICTTQDCDLELITPGMYEVTQVVQNTDGCVDTARFTLTVKEDFTFYIPNSFSPEDNRLNEAFAPVGIGWDTSSYYFLVFDRWGEQIFESKEVTNAWSGKANGGAEISPQGIYIWQVELKDLSGEAHQFRGHVLLLR